MHAHARRVSAAALFWPLWCLMAALQLLDAGTVWLVGADHRIQEVNPVLAFIEAHYGPLGATLVKLWGVGAWLVLVAMLYVLALRLRSRALAAACVIVLAAGAVYSAALAWNNLAALLAARAI